VRTSNSHTDKESRGVSPRLSDVSGLIFPVIEVGKYAAEGNDGSRKSWNEEALLL